MSYSSFKNTVRLITMSIFEENAHAAVYQNITRIDGFKFLNPNEFASLNFANPNGRRRLAGHLF